MTTIVAGFTPPGGVDKAMLSLLVPLLIFLTPLIFFHKNIRLYLYLLLPLVFITPVLLFLTFFFAIPPGFELIAFILQTNVREAKEAASPFLFYFIPFELLFVGLYFLALYYIPSRPLSFRASAALSGGSFLLLFAITISVNRLHEKPVSEITKHDLILEYEYPVTLAAGMNEARVFLKKNTLEEAKNFRYRAVKKDSVGSRQVYVLIIGESSRYDRWQINGYKRATSPKLAERKNLITYRDVVAGAHYTWVSVPQIITRASPDNYNLQYREKSILSAFKEAGFKTAWLSNQSDQDIFWSGTITLHAKTADVSIFSPTYSPNLEFENIYDGRLLPILDSILTANNENLFIVMHTMGNHWEYSRRYPREFDHYKPSGYTQSINPPALENKEAIINSYDNSIMYADFFIDEVIETVASHAQVSGVVFVSDHGEDLFDTRTEQLDFHFRPSAATLKVPLFIWTSELYNQIFFEKRKHIEENAEKKVGSENIFYSVLDIANIEIDGFDSTKTFASAHFLSSAQKFYGDDQQARLFSQIIE
jgi:glucan phosphoethanolaminetransferase (alkaline phosphatase superfamily)